MKKNYKRKLKNSHTFTQKNKDKHKLVRGKTLVIRLTPRTD